MGAQIVGGAERQQLQGGVRVCLVEGCGKSFSKSSGLTDHALRKSGQNGHPVVEGKCACLIEGCGESFLYPSELKKHAKNMSGKGAHPVDK